MVFCCFSWYSYIIRCECRVIYNKKWLLIKNLLSYALRNFVPKCPLRKYKNNKIPNEQPAFRCRPAFRSHSKLLTNKLFSSFFFIFLPKPFVSLSCPWWKKYFFTHFLMFLIIFDNANACASMRSLVKIHNRCHLTILSKINKFVRLKNTDLRWS